MGELEPKESIKGETKPEPQVPPIISTGGAVNDQKNQPTLEDYSKLQRDIKDLREDLRREKSSTLVIFGIFASIIAFLSANIQIFQAIKSPLSIFGIDLFILGGLGLFLLLLIEISKNLSSDSDFKNTNLFSSQIFKIVIGLIILGALFVYFDSQKIEVKKQNFLHEYYINYEN